MLGDHRVVEKWKIVYTKQAQKDANKLKSAHLADKTHELIKVISYDPYAPPYKKLVGDLTGILSRRINIQHRLIYQVFDIERTLKVIRMWPHRSLCSTLVGNDTAGVSPWGVHKILPYFSLFLTRGYEECLNLIAKTDRITASKIRQTA